MRIHRRNLLALMGALFIIPTVASAQFRDLSKRPNTDTTAINEFIKSYQRQLEPLYVHQTTGPRFGPLSGFKQKQFISESNETLPMESAETLVTMHTQWLLGAAIGSGIGSAAGIAGYVISANKASGTQDMGSTNTQNALLMFVALPAASFVAGALIGSLFPKEVNAAPMNAFRMR